MLHLFRSQHRWLPYLVATVAVAAVAALRYALFPVLGYYAPTLLFTLAVLLSAYVGGMGPGLFATSLSALISAYLFLEPSHSLRAQAPADQLRMVLFLLVGLGISAICNLLHRARRASEVESAALERSEERFRATFENAPVGIEQVAMDGRLMDVNPRLCRLLGYSREELLTRTFEEVTHPDDRPAERQLLCKLKLGELSSYVTEKRYLRKDGQPVWVRVSSSMATNPDNCGATNRISVIEDITHQREAEQHLRRSLRSIELLSDSATRLLLEEDPEKIIPSLLETMADHLGLEFYISYLVNEGGRTLRLHASRGLEPDVAQRIGTLGHGEAVCGSVAANGQRYVGEQVLGQADPRLALVRSMGIDAYTCHPLLANGRVVGTVSFGSKSRSGFDTEELELIRTLCDQIAMAMERKRLTEELKRRAAELAQASAAKDRFLATLSHELRTPLNPVLMTVSAMHRREDLPEPVREELELVLRNVELEARLIDDLLDLTRISRGKVELQQEPTDVHTLLRHAVEACCRSDINVKRLDLHIEPDAEQHTVWGDPARLQQVFWNLAKNAVKFTPMGGGITIRTLNLRPSFLTIEVKDTGIGIEPELLPRIFDAFEQGDRTITRRFGGLGLGLAISKTIVEMHGGRIEAESAGVDHGATFRVELPLYVPRPGEKPRDRGHGNGDGAVPSVNGRLSILLVEDHESTLQVVARVLKSMGHEVQTASTVAAAKSLAQSNGVDLVVSDLGLPDGNGYELMRHLRDRHHLRGIALSGYGMEEDISRSRDAGFAEHLVKPVNVQQLEAAVQRVAGSSAQALEPINESNFQS